MVELKPCPFCGVHLEYNPTFSTRGNAVYVHPASDELCVTQFVVGSSDSDRVARWNRREGDADLQRQLSEITEKFETERNLNLPSRELQEENDTLRKELSVLSAGDGRKFKLRDRVTKINGSSWTGRVVGFYTTKLTPIGYCVESENEPGSVQIYPEAALRAFAGGSDG